MRRGGGIYIYRTRKPMSLIGRLPVRELYVYPVGVAVAAVPITLAGAPWYLAIPAGLFLTGRHFGYVGETTSFEVRHRQHLGNIGSEDKYQHAAKPWADLNPVCVLRIPLPRWKWLLRTIETLVMVLTWPVYNHKKNMWNPRRIPLISARRQAYVRARRVWGLSWNFRGAHVMAALLFLILWGVM